MNTAAQPAAPATDRRPPRILVVDDERSMREMLQIVLRREGYEVLLAESGKAAIAALEREPIDLLISDIKMPDLSGVEVLRAAKRIDQDILAWFRDRGPGYQTRMNAVLRAFVDVQQGKR